MAIKQYGISTHKVKWSFNYVGSWDHVANLKSCTFFPRYMFIIYILSNDAKLDKVVTYHEKYPPTKSHDPLITWATWVHVINWKEYISAFKIFMFLEGWWLRAGTLTHQVMWASDQAVLWSHVTNWKRYIHIFTSPMTTETLETYNLHRCIPTLKITRLFDHMLTSCQVQNEKLVSPL